MIEYADEALKQLRKMDRAAQKRIVRYLDTKIAPSDDARAFGKPLRGALGGLWRYRVGDYRIICHIEDDRLLVLVLRIGDRKDVYRR
jgi:mRNA interferase RelE/StbE